MYKKPKPCPYCGKTNHLGYQCYQKNKILYQRRKKHPVFRKIKPLSATLGSKRHKVSSRKKNEQSERKKLIKELDKYTSLLCRWRYANPSGLVRCFTCSALSPIRRVDCGHYISRRFSQTRWDLKNVRPQCLTKGHKVGEKDISEIKVGDKVPSLLKETRVVAVQQFRSPIIELEYEGGVIRSSPEHMILVESRGGLVWLSAKQIYDRLKEDEECYIIKM